MERVISGIQSSDLSDPIKRVAAERLKLKSHGVNHNYSLYRDILFLAFVAIGRENIDQGMWVLKNYIDFSKSSVLASQKNSLVSSHLWVDIRSVFEELRINTHIC